MRGRHVRGTVVGLGIAGMLAACGPEAGTDQATGSVSNYEEAQRGEQSWDGRVEAYRKERDAVLADPNVGAAQREAALTVLRADHFDPSEYDRVEALDREETGE